ncbi:TSC22 domain family protein 1-like isoform X1 [Polyodon spathula]|uniref:TSC22 domain family protein 1-like isoform X1 n=1 Tax=Polyodon spathula TaxID=7913 RepID=UPI001B7E6F57|nr:TSC22 domain family protein 1-like isoform X1 [Polyodon spathula]
MHHPESAGDSTSRKMANPAIFHRRGSSTGSNALATAAGTSINSNVIPTDDYSSSILIQPPPPPTGSSSPGPQHPPQSLNLHSSQSQLQPQPLPLAGAQVKKKSGFQITSVTPAQISASTNNSITEDTESYDDLDESHTEDLSSSEILDVSLSRATDMGGPERSSSEETLNNFHEVETPGAVSPNQLLLPHSHHQPQPGVLANGNMHHSKPHGLPHRPPHAHPGIMPSVAVPGGGGVTVIPPVNTVTTASKLSAHADTVPENTSVVGNVVAQPQSAGTPGMPSGMNAAAGTPVNVVNPVTSNVNNVSVTGGSTASVPGLVGTSSSNGSSSGIPSGLMNLNANSGLTGVSNPNVIVMQQQQGTGGAVTMNIVMGAGSIAGGALSNVISGATGDIVVAAPVVVTTTAQTAPVATPPSQQHQAPPPTSSRFRVVKLDSSSEPFKKGRWTCTEYYDKEPPVSVAVASATSETVPSHRAVESIRQTQPDTTVGSERESTSGSSVSSTLSHYTESVGSGEMGAPSILQGFQQPQQVDYGSSQSLQASLPGLPQSVSQPQLAQAQMHSQEVAHSLMKTSGTPSVPSSIGNVQQQQTPMNLGSIQTTIGLPTATIPQQQQLPYTQQLQKPATAQMFHPPPQQQHAAPTQIASEHVMPVSQGGGVVGSLPPEFVHQQIIQPPMQPGPPGMGAGGQSLQHVPHIPGTVQPPPVSGNGQVMGMGQHGGNIPPGNYQTPPQAILQQQQTTSPPQGGILPQILPGTVSGLAQQHHQSLAQLPTHLPVEQQQQQSVAQGLAGQQPGAVSLGQVTSNVPLPAAAQSGMPPSAAQPLQNGSMITGGGQPTMMPASSAASTGHYLALRPFSAAQLEDARRLLLQDQTLLSLPKLAVGDGAANSMSAFAASASLFPLKTLPLAGQVVDGEEDSSSGASVVAIDNKIEQAMDLVKSHLMYAVREEVEVLKEQIKELIDRNSQLEQENNLLKNLASPEQLAQFQAQLQSGSPPASSQQPGTATQPAQPSSQSTGPSA